MLQNIKPPKKLIYLDNAATTPLDPVVLKAIQPYLTNEYGNPSSLYKLGQKSAEALADAREKVAGILSANPKEIIFTAGGTESINLAIFGIARAYELAHKKKGHIISSRIEHHAVLDCLDALKQEGWEITLVNVNKDGVVEMGELEKAVKKNTVLVSIMYANNEIGTIQPISEIGKRLAGLNRTRINKKLPRIYFHSDGCQAGNSLDLSTNKLGVDLLSINGSKIYGPKQVGALYVKAGTPLRPIIFGGGQERNFRSGTENVAGTVGFATALELAKKNREKENVRLKNLRDTFLTKILKSIPDISLNGADDRITKLNPKLLNGGLKRLPNNINISIKDIEGEVALFYLDGYNIAVSTGSACSSSSPDPSHVILALGKPQKDAFSSLRLSLGKYTSKAELDYVLTVLTILTKELRRIEK